jgi:hypothetical protein
LAGKIVLVTVSKKLSGKPNKKQKQKQKTKNKKQKTKNKHLFHQLRMQ